MIEKFLIEIFGENLFPLILIPPFVFLFLIAIIWFGKKIGKKTEEI